MLNNLEETNKLTDEQVETIAKQMDDEIKGTDLEKIANLPSNCGREERSKVEISEKGEAKKMLVMVDPDTGENKLIGPAIDSGTEDESFEDLCKRIENSEVKLDKTPITDLELKEYIDNSDSESLLKDICSEINISDESITILTDIVNRKMKNEEFNIYKAFPDEIRNMINKYVADYKDEPVVIEQSKQFINIISESLIDEFVSNIGIDRIKNDFNKELEDLFDKGSKEIADSVIGYTQERNKLYREYANNSIEDEEKREKINLILDQIDEAYNLTELKEFAKKCKIKKIELEKPFRIYSTFLSRYNSSEYNIYDINIARPILYRNINLKYNNEYDGKDIDAFFVLFCKQCQNKKPNVSTDHAYMYYLIYNTVLLDMNKGESKHISDKFLSNIKEVIDNIRIRNNY